MTSFSVRRPMYVVACDLPGTLDHRDEPLLFLDPDKPAPFSGTFDERLGPSLVGIRYALHLPKTRFETLKLPSLGIQDMLNDSRKSIVYLVPTEFLTHDRFPYLTGMYERALIICPVDALPAAHEVSRNLGFTLPPTSLDALSQKSLDDHWAALTTSWEGDWPEGVKLDPKAPRWLGGETRGGSDLSQKRLARLLGDCAHEPTELPDDSDNALQLLMLRARVHALVTLEGESLDYLDEEVALARLDETVRAIAPTIRAKLVISLPGVAPRYRKKVGGTPSSEAPYWSANHRSAMETIVAHDATESGAMGVLRSSEVPDEAFHALAALEKHWIDGAKPAKVKALLTRLNTAARDLWTDALLNVVRHSSSIHAFTNFPFGLLTVPGDTAPLAAQVPLAYRSVNPLTRALQVELIPTAGIELGGQLRVLIAECIPADDPVGQASRNAWQGAAEMIAGASISVEVHETLSINSLRAKIEELQPSVLIISAHGFHRPDSNLAGLIIGDEPAIGLELGDMPPLVILSACHTGPRGGGVVAVSDMLIASGATAVLSTLVPVDVFHNSIFTVRFLMYLALAASGEEPELTVLDVWHRVQQNSVIVDIVYGNTKLRDWAHTRNNGESPIEEYMNHASRGRVRATHSYEDAEAVLIEIADRRGSGAKVRAWLKNPGYLPESIMYTMMGYPESIRLPVRE